MVNSYLIISQVSIIIAEDESVSDEDSQIQIDSSDDSDDDDEST